MTAGDVQKVFLCLALTMSAVSLNGPVSSAGSLPLSDSPICKTNY